MKLVRVARDMRDATRDYYLMAEFAREVFDAGKMEQLEINGGWMYHDPRGYFYQSRVTPNRHDHILAHV